MSKTIWKFEVPVTDRARVAMPAGARVLSVEIGKGLGVVWLWAEVDPAADVGDRGFRVVGTGNPLPEGVEDMRFLGTVLDGPFVWHVYEEAAAPAGAVCSSCGRTRGQGERDYNPMQAITGGPLGWYSGEDGEICAGCMERIIRGQP